MRKAVSNKAIKGLANCARSLAKISANSACLFISHQPKEPKALEELKKV